MNIYHAPHYKALTADEYSNIINKLQRENPTTYITITGVLTLTHLYGIITAPDATQGGSKTRLSRISQLSYTQ